MASVSGVTERGGCLLCGCESPQGSVTVDFRVHLSPKAFSVDFFISLPSDSPQNGVIL